MTEDAKRFDLMSALQGANYPEDVVTVYLHEELTYLLNQINEKHLHDPANKELKKLLDKAHKELEPFAIKVTIKGVPLGKRRAMLANLNKEMPPKEKALGGVEFPDGYSEEFQKRRWALYVAQFEDAEGATSVPSPEEIEAFLEEAPESAVTAIDNAITRMIEDSATGYELAIQELPFLSQP